ncbi:MAG: hypothetical protein IT559_06345 [Alphaproteobacteria bacterium]|nr:hypothetical protein [Alphaproteobacteria bacterium]
MSDSGPINFIPSAGALPEKAGSASERTGSAQLIGAPEDVREEVSKSRRPLKLRGEVVRENRDGSVRVQTRRGDVDIRPAPGQRPPEKGQKVEIEIYPNRAPNLPPETANIRPAPRADTPPATSTDTEITLALDPAQRQPPRVQITYPPAEPRPVSSNGQSLPPEGVIVRLLPLPLPGQSAADVTAPAPSLPPQIINAAPEQGVFSPLAPLPAAITPGAQSGLTHTILPHAQPAAGEHTTINTGAQTGQLPQLSNQAAPLFLTAPQFAFPQETQSGAAPQILTGSIPPLAGTEPPALPIALLAPSSFSAVSMPGGQALNVQILSAAPPPPVLSNAAAPLSPENAFPAPEGQTPPETLLNSKNALIDAGIKTRPALLLQNGPAGSLSATITGKTVQNLPILSINFPASGLEQSYIMQFPGEGISPGTTLQLMPQSLPQTAKATATPLPGEAAPFSTLVTPGPWPLMDEILRNLMQISPQATQALLSLTPSSSGPAQQMSPAILFFIAAVRGGDLTQWLGDKTTDILRRAGRGALLSRLAQEGSTLSRVAAEPLSQDWRAVNLPLYHQGELHKIALYYKHESPPDDAPEGGGLKGTRFIFDLALSTMGRAQLDGLFRPVSSAGKRLDLAVRTERVFSSAAQAEMRRLYAKALRDTQVTGELSFQNRPEQWVNIDTDRKNALGVSV